MAFALPPCLQMVPVERGWLSGPSEAGNLRVLMLGGQCCATPSLLSPGAWTWSPLPALCLWCSPSLLHRLDLLKQPPFPPPPPKAPLSLPWDRLSSTWQGSAWITGIPQQVSLLRKVSSACVCETEREKEGEVTSKVTSCWAIGKVFFSNPMNK